MALKQKGGIFEHRYRYFILMLGTLCLTSICANMITLNFTFICMIEPQKNHEASLTTNNDTKSEFVRSNLYLNYGQTEKSFLLWAVAVGTLLGVWPFQYLFLKFGARYVLFSAGILSATVTAAIPYLAFTGFNWFVAARMLQGVAYGADFSAIGVITVRWASLKQNGIFIAVLTSFNNIASIVTNPVAGMLCESRYGWPATYYAHSFFGFIITLAFFICYDDDPQRHKKVSPIELEKIHRNKSEAHKNNDKYIPYLAIIKNPVVIAIWLNAFAEIASSQLLQAYGPTYIKNVLNFSIEKTGYLVAGSVFVMLPVRYLCGFLSDKIRFISETRKLIVFNTVSVTGCGLFYSLLGFTPRSFPYIAVAVMSLINIVVAVNVGGFYKCATLVARQHSHFVISNIQFIKCVSLFVSPGLVAVFVQDDTSQVQWRTVFLILSFGMFVANIIFCFNATERPANFTSLIKPEKKKPSIYVVNA